MLIRNTFAVLLALALAGPALSATWADSMFDELSRDFGAVPMGQTLTHHFRVKNNTGKVVTIGTVRPSCVKCTSVTALKTRLNPGEETSILVQMDTSKFVGLKTVTIFVRFDEPQYEEVRLWVAANSREDLAVTPETFDFGQVKRGDSIAKNVKISFLGGSPARINEVTCDSNYVQTTFKELKRTETYVEYLLSAELRPDVPAGKWYTMLWVKTNNSTIPKLSVPLTVEVTAPLDLTPGFVQFGEVKVGSQDTRRIVLRGIQPFKITAIQGADDQIQVKDTVDESKQMHVLIVTFKPTHMGDLDQTIKIVTDLKEGNELKFPVHGKAIGELREVPRELAPGKFFGRRKPPKD